MKARHAALKHVGSSHRTPDDEGLDSDVTDFPGIRYKIGVKIEHSLKYSRISHFKIETEFELAYLHGNKPVMFPAILDITFV